MGCSSVGIGELGFGGSGMNGQRSDAGVRESFTKTVLHGLIADIESLVMKEPNQ